MVFNLRRRLHPCRIEQIEPAECGFQRIRFARPLGQHPREILRRWPAEQSRESADGVGDSLAAWAIAALAADVEVDSHGCIVWPVPIHGRGLDDRQPVLRTA